jgi:HAE1 family hydrophobic/amphiphilic exporter-1
MVPLTLAETTSIGLSYKSFGLTLIGGMTTATLLTLLVVPVAYTLFDDARAALTSLLGRAARPSLGSRPSTSQTTISSASRSVAR